MCDSLWTDTQRHHPPTHDLTHDPRLHSSQVKFISVNRFKTTTFVKALYRTSTKGNKTSSTETDWICEGSFNSIKHTHHFQNCVQVGLNIEWYYNNRASDPYPCGRKKKNIGFSIVIWPWPLTSSARHVTWFHTVQMERFYHCVVENFSQSIDMLDGDWILLFATTVASLHRPIQFTSIQHKMNIIKEAGYLIRFHQICKCLDRDLTNSAIAMK